ncbi:MAG: lipoate--protein ligase family protein, partial [Ignavibacteriaceae bacterium]|nr:lipoate--protein ligase family protein [Ignavibacteriaceae bacterium]
GLEIYNFKLSSLNLEQDQPHFPSFYKEAKSDLCFAVSAKSEINLDGKKLVGSAQRKIGDVVLQHGSILCGTFHKNLIDYLKVSAEEKREIEKEINETTIELETIINSETDYTKLIQALKSGFERHFNISFLANKELDLVH